MMECIEIGGRKVIIEGRDRNVPAFLWAVSREHAEDEFKRVTELIPVNMHYILIAYQIDCWNDELSMKPFKTGRFIFGGKGEKTLDFLKQELIPYVNNQFAPSETVTLGYSLSGLFALNCLTAGIGVTGAVSASGSLWYEGMPQDFMGEKIPEGAKVYLSLGKKEEHTANPVMKKVGENTRLIYEYLKNEKSVDRCVLVMNEGGHFDNPEERLARGIKWMLNGEI